MNSRWMMGAAIIGILLIGGALVGPIMSDVEIPNYEVLAAEQTIEIRRYQPMIIAEVEVVGERKAAINGGFRLLADYIFGNNTLQQEIAMTAPVAQRGSQKIAMTAPVQQESAGQSWRVSFIMPAEYSLESLPKPNDARVLLRAVPAQQFAVIRFSGLSSDNNINQHEQQLMDYVHANALTVIGAAKYAFYNPPWTLPPMRRNEVMVEIDGKESRQQN